ncbi:hypothetical protein [Streptomyces sp. NBC_00454]|uniref:hypothetical protein n=1 Tax=Streptomyces sp. NBC_00454 TaxID=2975747 RepID=UPI0030DEE5F3
MQLRRVLPLSLFALLASAGCVSVGPQASDGPAHASVPPADAPDTAAADGSAEAGAPTGAAGPAGPGGPVNASDPHGLPLGRLPAPTAPTAGAGPGASGPDPARRSANAARKGAEHRSKPAAPRHPHPPKTAPARTGRQPAPPPGLDELCAAAEGSVPPSIVDLCLRQSGR